MVGTRQQAEALAAHPGRHAGTDAERRAAGYLRQRLADMGREAGTQAIQVHPRFGLAHALHAVLAVVGSVVAVGSPALGSALVLAAVLLTALDASGLLQLVRRGLGRRASQNVESREHGGKPGVLVLVAAYDAPRESGAFGLATRLLRDPWRAMVIAMLLLLACCVLRVGGIDSTVLTAVQFVPTVLLIVMLPALVDIELSPTGPDAAGAGAVATVLRLAGELGGRLEHFDVWVVLAGATHPFAAGMGSWLRQAREDLERESTAVVAIGPAGDGPVRYTRREGALLTQRCHRDLVRLGEEVAEDAGSPEVQPYVDHTPSNTSRALARGLPAITLSTAGAEPADDEALERLGTFARELIERLDAEVGPTLSDER